MQNTWNVKKPEDLAKDPIVEIEYFGGKPEPEVANGICGRSGINGHQLLGFRLENTSYAAMDLGQCLQSTIAFLWIQSGQTTATCATSFTSQTERLLRVAAKPAVPRVSYADLFTYIAAFADTEKSANRLKDAKEFRTNIRTGENGEYPLRAFNLVMFESKLSEIKEILQCF